MENKSKLFLILGVAVVVIVLILLFSFSSTEEELSDSVTTVSENSQIVDNNIYLKAGIFDPALEYPIPKDLTTDMETGYFIVQFNSDENFETTKELLEKGKIIDFIPQNTLVLKTDLTKEQIKEFEFVRFVDIFQPAYKLSPELRTYYDANKLNDEKIKLDLLVNVHTNIGDVQKQIGLLGDINIEKSGDSILQVLNLPLPKLLDLIKIKDVLYVETKFPEELMNAKAGEIINVYNDPDGIRKYGLKGKGQIIGIADSGLDSGYPDELHPDLKKSFLKAYSLGRKVEDKWGDLDGHGTHVAGSVIGDGTASPIDNTGMAPEAKIIFQSLLSSNMPLAPTGLGGIPDDLNALFLQVYNESPEARIHTNSWGGVVRNIFGIIQIYGTKSRQIDKFMWEHKDMLILFAAANDGLAGPGSLSVQANSKNALIVGASESENANLPVGNVVRKALESPYFQVTSDPLPQNFIDVLSQVDIEADSRDDVAVFSSRGPASGNRIKPDVVAPGTWILSTRSQICTGKGVPNSLQKGGVVIDGIANHKDCVGKGLPGNPVYGFSGLAAGPAYDYADLWSPGIPGTLYAGPYPVPANPNIGGTGEKFYMYLSGTSMATPIVAGSAALVREYYQKVKNMKKPSAALLKATIINGAEDMPPTGPGHPGSTTGPVPNFDEGFGRVNIAKSLYPHELQTRVYFSEPTMYKEGDNAIFYLRASSKFPLNITLTWTDYPNSFFTAGSLLIDDLDMVAVSPSDIVYVGNVTTNGISTPNPVVPNDHFNNVEKIIIPNPEDGIYKVTVTASKLNAVNWGLANKQEFALVASEIVGVESSGNSYLKDGFSKIIRKNLFVNPEDSVYVYALGLGQKEEVNVYVLDYFAPFANASALVDVRGQPTGITSDENGMLIYKELWKNPFEWVTKKYGNGKYKLVVDRNKNGIYDENFDVAGFFNKPDFAVPAITSSDKEGEVKDLFVVTDDSEKESVFVKGGGFDANKTMNIYMIKHQKELTSGMEIFDYSGVPTSVTTDASGKIPLTVIMEKIHSEDSGDYDIIADVDSDGKYTKNIDAEIFDALDSFNEIGFTIKQISKYCPSVKKLSEFTNEQWSELSAQGTPLQCTFIGVDEGDGILSGKIYQKGNNFKREFYLSGKLVHTSITKGLEKYTLYSSLLPEEEDRHEDYVNCGWLRKYLEYYPDGESEQFSLFGHTWSIFFWDDGINNNISCSCEDIPQDTFATFGSVCNLSPDDEYNVYANMYPIVN